MKSISGQRIAALRGRRTQTDLASALRARGFGTTQTTVSRWEAGQEPRSSVVHALAAELGVTVDELYADDDKEAARAVSLDAFLRTRVREIMAEERKERGPA